MTTKDWKFPSPYPDSFGDTLKKHRYIKQYLWNKGYTEPEYMNALLYGKVTHDTNPFLMKDMELTVNRLWGAIRDKEKIVVFGDYDADGVTSVSIMYLALKYLGASVDWFTPSREDGYGASPSSMEKVNNLYHPKLVITTDNGIKAEPAAAWAVENGIEFLITDHHSVDYDNFPSSAFSVVNPSQTDCEYPTNNMAGCGVAYKVAHGLALWGKEMGYYNEMSLGTPDEFAYQFLDLVAIGSIADMMSMASLETRWMVREGLKLIRNNPRLGVKTLCEAGYGLDHTTVNATDVAFSIAPKINASGRLDLPDHAVELMIATDYYDAQKLAEVINDLNTERKEIQRDITRKVFDDLSHQDTSVNAMPVIIHHIECPHGLVGLVAGDVCREYNRPAIMMCTLETNDGVVAYTGSARSIEGVNITEILSLAADTMFRYGGHAGAAGMTLAPENYKAFIEAIYAGAKVYKREELEPEVIADIQIGLHEIDGVFLDIYEALEPAIGVDFPMLSFITCNLKVLDVRVWGSNKNHLELSLCDDLGNKYKANGWFMAEDINSEEDVENFPERVDIAYIYEIADIPYQHARLKLNDWRATPSVEPIDLTTRDPIMNSEQARNVLGARGRRRL